MKLLIIGGVAGGATAAARARRISEAADITVVERGPYVSFANCGLPYFISRDIGKRSKLLQQTPGSPSRREQGEDEMAGNTVKEKIQAGARIVDVRTPAEFADGSYPGAVNIPLSVLAARMNELEPRDTPIVLYCASGARSGQGARLLKQAGFTDVINAGGLGDMPK